MLGANRGSAQVMSNQAVMKEGPTALLKHRLRGKPIKKKKKKPTLPVYVHRQSVAMTLLQLWLSQCVTDWKVQYHINAFQAISAYFMLVFTSLLFPAEGALGWK